jgi:hypothetical protein
MTAAIYKFYGPAVFVPLDLDDKDEKGKQKVKLKYKCLFCEQSKLTNKDGTVVYVAAYRSTTSNLIAHLEKESHSSVLEEYTNAKTIQNDSPLCKKRKLFAEATSTPSSPSRNLQSMGFAAVTLKYGPTSVQQMNRYFFYLISMYIYTHVLL